MVATPRLPSKPGKRARSAVQGRLDLGPTGAYETPALTLLDLPKDAGRNESLNRDALEKNARLLESVLEDFGVRGEIVKVRPGPVVTRYEQIGRASCRGRVCQYVSISVVAVSLIQNT